MVTKRTHQVACRRGSVVWRVERGARSGVVGVRGTSVNIGKHLLLGCALWMSASASASASTDLPPRSLSFAYRVTHPAFPLPHSVIASVYDPDAEPLVSDEASAVDFEEPTRPDVGARPRAPSQPALCRTVADVASTYDLPVPFFANLIWAESSFNTKTISRAGAQGIAQFMPKTAVMYGLENPFEPIHAINVSARFLSELRGQFGNLGLAAAAYNAGPRRVVNWLAGRGALPAETQRYVEKITGRPVEQWVGAENVSRAQIEPMPAKAPCVEVAEAVLEQTRLARIANLMRDLAASVPPPVPEQPALVAQTPRKGETRAARATPERDKSLRLAKLRPSIKDLRGRTQLAESQPSKLEARSADKRNAKAAIRAALQQKQRFAASDARKVAQKAPGVPPKGADGAASKQAAKPEAPRKAQRAVRRTRVAYSIDNRLH